MTQHLRNGKDAKKLRQQSALARQAHYATLSEEERALHDAAQKAEYELGRE